MAAIRQRLCHISAPVNTRSFYNTTFSMFFGARNPFLKLFFSFEVNLKKNKKIDTLPIDPLYDFRTYEKKSFSF